MSQAEIHFPRPRDLGKRQWGREILLVETSHYLGKRLEMKAGMAGGLQKHVQKDESFLLVSGCAALDTDDGAGALRRITLYPGTMVHVPPGVVHRVTALQDSIFYEWSSPHFDDRIRCEAEYGEPEVGGLPSTHEPSPDATGQP